MHHVVGFCAAEGARAEGQTIVRAVSYTHLAHSVWNCGMALAMESSFEESYAVRAMIKAGKMLGLGRTEKRCV